MYVKTMILSAVTALGLTTGTALADGHTGSGTLAKIAEIVIGHRES